MSNALPIRIGFLLSAVAPILFWMLLGVSWAQQAPVGVPPEKAQQFLNLLSDPEVKMWLEGRIPSAAAEPPAGSPVETISSWEAAIRDRVDGLFGAVPRIPEELASGAAVVSRDVNLGRPGLVVSIFAVLIAVGLGAEWLIPRVFARARKSGANENAGQEILPEIAALLKFALASVSSFLAFEWPPCCVRSSLRCF
nr:mechanosensitive ion channel family protein [Sinorhizobium meliloti]